jgi:DNA polymerase III delta subunit
MPRLAFPRLAASLKTSVAPTYYIYGAEAILKDDAVSAILERVLDPATRDFNLDIVSAQQLDPVDLPAACATLPMMAAYRAVVLRDVEAWKRKSKAKQPAMSYLDRPMPETVLIMVQGGDDDPDTDLASRCTAVECSAPEGDRLDAWLAHEFDARGVRLTDDAREHLLRSTGAELGLLRAEVEKLSGVQGEVPLDRDLVGALVGVRFGETVDDWRDAVLRDQTAHALDLVPPLLGTTGISGVKLVTLLGTSLLVLRWARATAERHRIRDAALATRVKNELLFKVRASVGSYDPVARLMAEVVGRWSEPRIRAATRAALQADIALKSTTISDEAGIVTDMVLTIAATRARKAA